MTVKDLINRAYMQVGDTSQVNYTPYQFLEFYNEGNHILHKIVLRYIPDILRVTETGVPNRPTIALSSFALQIISVKDMYGNLNQVGNETKAKYQTSRKYTCNDYIAYLKNNHLYLNGPGFLEYVEIEGILEDPTKVADCYDYDGPYPIPANMIPTLKNLIFSKELNIMLTVPTDNTNNSTNDVKQ